MCNFTYMETQAPALPVTPLTDEQTPHFKQLMPERMAELEAVLLSHERRMGIKNNVEHLRDYGGMAAGDYRSHVPALLAHIEAQAEFASHYLSQRDLVKAENARLSLLLEEERRTGGEELAKAQARAEAEGRRAEDALDMVREQREKVTSLLEDLTNGCEPSRLGADYYRGVNSERARLLAWAELKCAELGIAWPIKPIPYKSDLPSEPAPTCQRDCQKCEKKEPVAQVKNLYSDSDAFAGLDRCECQFEATAEDQWISDLMGITTCVHCGGLLPAAGGAGVGLQGEEGKGVQGA